MRPGYKQAITAIDEFVTAGDIDNLMRDTAVLVVAKLWEKPVKNIASDVLKKRIKKLNEIKQSKIVHRAPAYRSE
jgi:hypothetical protein